MAESDYVNFTQAQDVKPIDYRDCSNAMLMMWMENILTDGEYNRIMDKLIAKNIKKWRNKSNR